MSQTSASLNAGIAIELSVKILFPNMKRFVKRFSCRNVKLLTLPLAEQSKFKETFLRNLNRKRKAILRRLIRILRHKLQKNKKKFQNGKLPV